MSEPIDPEPYREYGQPVPADVPPEDRQPASGNLARGVLAGAGAAVLGALVWGLVVYVTRYEVGFLAVLVGVGVGYAVHRGGRLATVGAATAAAVVAACGILLGFVLVSLLALSLGSGIGLGDALSMVGESIGWPAFVKDSMTADGLSWLFLAIGAFTAFRLVLGQRRPARRSPG
jgi:hypothetical protein